MPQTQQDCYRFFCDCLSHSQIIVYFSTSRDWQTSGICPTITWKSYSNLPASRQPCRIGHPSSKPLLHLSSTSACWLYMCLPQKGNQDPNNICEAPQCIAVDISMPGQHSAARHHDGTRLLTQYSCVLKSQTCAKAVRHAKSKRCQL